MEWEWVTLVDAVNLEGVEYNSYLKRIQRNQYFTKTEPSPNGGKDRVFVHVSSLSEQAQEKLRHREREAIARDKAKQIQESGEPPWYVTVDYNWYYQNYKDEYLKKTAMAQELDKFLQEKKYRRGETTEFTETFAAEHLGISGKQMRRYLSRYQEGRRWQYAQETEQPGSNYGYYQILALCTPPKVGQGLKLTDEMMQLICNLWSDELYQKNNQTITMLYEDFCRCLRSDGAEYIPSYNTVKRFVDALEYNNGNVATLLKHGVTGWRHDAMLKKHRDLSKLQVMELVQGDAHTFDCWVSYTDPQNGKTTALRPYLVAFIDTRSRVIVGWGICIQPNAEVIKQVLIHMMYPKPNSPISGVPKALYIDNGKDFTAQTLTGRKRSQRFDIDSEIKGFYKSMGIIYDKRALPYTPWTKAEIERYFGTLCQQFSKRFPSYTGTLTGSKTSGKVKKDISGMLSKGDLPDMEAFASMFEVYLEQYHNKIHNGLKNQNESDPRPLAVFENAPRYYRAAPPYVYALAQLGKTEERVITNVGIEICGRLYTHEQLGKYMGERVLVRYHPHDLRCVSVCRKDGVTICEAYTYDKLDADGGRDNEALLEHFKAQKRQLKQTRDAIQSMRTPYRETGLELPELLGEQKIIAIPQDRQYRQKALDAAPKQPAPKKRRTNDEFIRAQAQAALEKLG